MAKRKRRILELLESRQMLAANPILTEFVASNDGPFEDGEGATSDWLEVYNAGDEPVDLVGYSLTDDPSDLDKWTFPSSQLLDSGDFLVVFASGDGTPDSAGNWHTNFALAASEEYLALVDPEGSVVSEFGADGANYPPQITGVSYGLAFDSSSSVVVAPESAARFWVPTNSSVDGVWMDPGFDDQAWTLGTASIGYDNNGDYFGGPEDDLIETTVPPNTTSVYIRIPFTISDAGQLLDKLQLKYDDGFIAYINGERVDSRNAPDVGAHNSIAGNEHPDALAVNFVDFDMGSYSQLLNVGENTLAIHLLNRSNSSDLMVVPRLLTISGGLIEPLAVGALQSPTPRTPNTNLRSSDVQLSHVGGAFAGSFQLTMTSDDPTESIRYTTDGSDPTAFSPLYTEPITINDTTRLRARSFGANGEVGVVTAETYTLTAASTLGVSSDLPIIVLENYGQGTPGTGDFEDAFFSLYEVDPVTGRSALASDADLTTNLGQHRRGRSTAGNPKTNLRIETRDVNGEDQSYPLLGMPAESDWVLYAPYTFDRAMMRNTTFFEMQRLMGRWAPRTRFVEVYANFDGDQLDSGDYMGVYVLMESIKRDDDRVDIAELTPSQNSEPQITGGYILSLDAQDNETPPDGAWKTNRNIPTLGDSWLKFEDPERPELTQTQVNYIRGYIQDFEDALFGPNSTDPELGYEAYFDVDASIDHHIIRVLSKEPDGLRLSTFLTKDRDGKLAYGPIWDSDRSAGADNDSRSSNPEGWQLPDVDFFESDWWGPLFDDQDFMQRWIDRWQELRRTVLSDDNIQAIMDAQKAQLDEAQARNFQRWPNIAPNGGQYAAPGGSAWDREVSHLTNWLLIRANWMDSQLVEAPNFSPNPGNVSAGIQVALASGQSEGEIYYTLDGSDPRADGGGMSPSAVRYTGPITVDETTQVNARTFGVPPTSTTGNSSYPFNETPQDGIDGNVGTKYLNFGEENSGIIITPNFGPSTVRSFRLTTANDAVERDPTSWELYGTNEPIQSLDNSTGLAEEWTLIDTGNVSLPASRNTNGPIVSVSNDNSYTSYKLMFPTVKNASSANSMQVAEIRFYESSNGSGQQILSSGGQALAVHVDRSPTSQGLSPWSELTSGLFSVEVPANATSLRINELHYHPANPTQAESNLLPGIDDDDFEFVELVNISDNTISLNGVKLGGGITFDFTTADITSLAPGAALVVVENLDAFTVRYGDALPVAGVYQGNLRNSGEQVILTDALEQTIHDFTYDDVAPWPTSADGNGPSLEVVDKSGDYSSPSNWRASVLHNGTPGSVGANLPGDFNQDDDIDGSDILAWQRGYGAQFDDQDLADWEANFGVGAAALASEQAVTPQLAATPAALTSAEKEAAPNQSAVDDAEFFDTALAMWQRTDTGANERLARASSQEVQRDANAMAFEQFLHVDGAVRGLTPLRAAWEAEHVDPNESTKRQARRRANFERVAVREAWNEVLADG